MGTVQETTLTSSAPPSVAPVFASPIPSAITVVTSAAPMVTTPLITAATTPPSVVPVFTTPLITAATPSAAPVFTTPVILIISLGAYVFAVVVLLVIKEILVSKGKCTQSLCPCCDCCTGEPSKKNDCLDSWCLRWAECCNCCGPPDVATAQWWDQCCARRKDDIDCYDVILCQCGNDCNFCADLCCDPTTPLCNCQGFTGCGNCCDSCVCQCSKPECQKIDCCCCEIQLKGGQGVPPGGGYPNDGGGYGGEGSYGGQAHGGDGGYGRDRYGRGGYDDRGRDDRSYGGRGGYDRWENNRSSRDLERGERQDVPLREQPRGGNPFLASESRRGGDGGQWRGVNNGGGRGADSGQWQGGSSGGDRGQRQGGSRDNRWGGDGGNNPRYNDSRF